MKRLLFYFLIISPLVSLADIKINSDLLEDLLTLEGDTIHTLKIEIKNETSQCQLLYLTKNEMIPGNPHKDTDWRSPLTFLCEYCGIMSLDLKEWTPMMFTVWFKKVRPEEKFTFYFQYTGDNITPQMLKDTIRFTEVKCAWKEADDLSWKGNIVIIPLLTSSPSN